NPLAALHLERLRAEIGKDDLHFAAIILVDRARRVQAGDAVLERQSRAGTHLDLMARRDGDGEAGRDSPALARPEDHVLGGDHVEAGGPLARGAPRAPAPS